MDSFVKEIVNGGYTCAVICTHCYRNCCHGHCCVELSITDHLLLLYIHR